MRGLLFFSGANPTRDFYPISRLYWRGWEGSHSISKCDWSQSKRVTALPSQPCLYQGPATSFPGFHQSAECHSQLSILNCAKTGYQISHTNTLLSCVMSPRRPVTMLCYRDITASPSSHQLQLIITLLHHAAITTAGPAV